MGHHIHITSSRLHGTLVCWTNEFTACIQLKQLSKLQLEWYHVFVTLFKHKECTLLGHVISRSSSQRTNSCFLSISLERDQTMNCKRRHPLVNSNVKRWQIQEKSTKMLKECKWLVLHRGYVSPMVIWEFHLLTFRAMLNDKWGLFNILVFSWYRN